MNTGAVAGVAGRGERGNQLSAGRFGYEAFARGKSP
jgi:hypothetical protein